MQSFSRFPIVLGFILILWTSLVSAMDGTQDEAGQIDDASVNLEDHANPPAVFQHEQDDQWVDDNVSILWFPHIYLEHTHLEICVDNQPWNSYGGFRKTSKTLDQLRDSVLEGNDGLAFYKFNIRVTQSELEKLRNYLNEREDERNFLAFCSKGVCNALLDSTGMFIPPLIAHLPSFTAIYLAALHKVGFYRISSIESVGTSLKDVFTSMGPYGEVVVTTSMATTLIGLTVFFNQMSLNWSQAME